MFVDIEPYHLPICPSAEVSVGIVGLGHLLYSLLDQFQPSPCTVNYRQRKKVETLQEHLRPNDPIAVQAAIPSFDEDHRRRFLFLNRKRVLFFVALDFFMSFNSRR